MHECPNCTCTDADGWHDAKSPPSDSRCVILRFDDSGERDCSGFYWSAEGSWYKSIGSKARRNAVHPVKWRELEEADFA